MLLWVISMLLQMISILLSETSERSYFWITLQSTPLLIPPFIYIIAPPKKNKKKNKKKQTNIERHTAHTIVSWLNPQLRLMINIPI